MTDTKNDMHEFYPVKEDQIIKDKGLQSFEIKLNERKIVVKRAYVIQDPEDEDLTQKIKWRDVIDYRRCDELQYHFNNEDIKRIHKAIWDEEFVKKFEAEEAKREQERTSKKSES